MADLNKVRYTHRDYESIKSDLISAIPSLTQEWTSREESDPGIVLIKLMSMLGDTLSYNIDKIALELYLRTVTQRKNCSKILELLGYKMHWYRSATVGVNVKLTREFDDQGNPIQVILVPFQTTLKSSSGDLTYSVIGNGPGTGDIIIDSSEYNTLVNTVEGKVVKVQFKRNNLTNNRYYFSDYNVDEGHLWLVFGSSHVFNLVDNLYTVTDDTQGSFEFNVDEFDRPYIELVKYWEDIVGNTAATSNFTLYYVVSKGASGNVSKNQLTKLQGVGGNYKPVTVQLDGSNVYPASSILVMTHPGTTDSLTDFEESNQYVSIGQDPQTVEIAKKDSSNYVFTHDTLITSSDYEKAVRRVTGITASKILDSVIIEHEGLDSEEVATRCDDKFEIDTEEDNLGVIHKYLKPYQVIIYSLFKGVESLSESQDSSNIYSIKGVSKYYFESYDEFEDSTLAGNEEFDKRYELFKSLGFFPYKPIAFIQTQISDLIKDTCCINDRFDFGTVKVFPFTVKGTLYLTEPISPQDLVKVIDEINNSLTEYYYPRSTYSFGDLPKFMDIVDVVQSSNVNVKYFDATGSLIDWGSISNIDKFDTTSFAKYNGLNKEFKVAPQFMKFRIKNTLSIPSYLTNLSRLRYKSEYDEYMSQPGAQIDQFYKDICPDMIVQGKSYLTVQVRNYDELKSLCEDLRSQSNLFYAR